MMRTQFTLFSAFKISQIVEARLLLIFIEYTYKNDLQYGSRFLLFTFISPGYSLVWLFHNNINQFVYNRNHLHHCLPSDFSLDFFVCKGNFFKFSLC